MPLAEIELSQKPNKSDVHVIHIETEYKDRYAIKSVPGYDWVKAGIWEFPITWPVCVALRGVFGSQLTIGPKLAAWANKEKQERIDPSMLFREGLTSEGDEQLFEPQRACVKWLHATKRGCLGDPTGTGKTREILFAIKEENDSWPALIITPNQARLVWLQEVVKLGWEDDIDVIVLDGSSAQRTKQLEGIEGHEGERKLIVVTNWESIRSLSRLAPYGSTAFAKCVEHGGEDPKITDTRCEVHIKPLNRIKWATVIRDEAHRAKDPQSKQTRASWSLTGQPSVKYSWDTTGTPIAENLGDLWAVMHGNTPDEYPRKGAFIERYAIAEFNSWGGLEIGGINPKTRDEFFSFFEPRFRRMPKKLLLPFLPELVLTERVCTMGAKQKAAYNAMAATMIAELESGVVVTTNPLTQYIRMIEFASAYAEVDDMNNVLLQAPSCKVNAMMEILGDLDDQIAISMVSRKLLELCANELDKKGISYARINGGQDTDEREEERQSFQRGDKRVILFMAQTGGTALTLTAAPYLVRLQRSWSNIENVQTEGRIDRIGAEIHSQITLIDVLTEGTLEVGRQMERLIQKRLNLNEVLRDAETLKKVLYGKQIAA
jgi:SNF2 family DNA or RNA helicase